MTKRKFSIEYTYDDETKDYSGSINTIIKIDDEQVRCVQKVKFETGVNDSDGWLPIIEIDFPEIQKEWLRDNIVVGKTMPQEIKYNYNLTRSFRACAVENPFQKALFEIKNDDLSKSELAKKYLSENVFYYFFNKYQHAKAIKWFSRKLNYEFIIIDIMILPAPYDEVFIPPIEFITREKSKIQREDNIRFVNSLYDLFNENLESFKNAFDCESGSFSINFDSLEITIVNNDF